MKVRLFEQGDADNWQRYVNSHEGATLYHEIGWKRAVEETYGHRPYYLLAESVDGRIHGVLPMFLVRNMSLKKRLISVPFAPYGGICCDDAVARLFLAEEALRLGRGLGVSYCEFRDLGANKPYEGCKPTAYFVTDIVDLSPGMGQVWDAINKNVKRKINKGMKSGLTFNIKDDSDAVLRFYDLYARTMSRLGTPVHSAAFFMNIRKHLPVYVANVEYEGEVISSLYLLRYKDTMIYGWGASLQEHLKLSPNAYNYWCSMGFAHGLGLARFDFGRSLVGSGNYHFKEGWGAKEIPLTYLYYPPANAAAPPQSQYGKLAAVWSKLPVGLSRLVGPELRKYVP
jgi:FemAB-related protein (PEP-CTERM system-associated)